MNKKGFSIIGYTAAIIISVIFILVFTFWINSFGLPEAIKNILPSPPQSFSYGEDQIVLEDQALEDTCGIHIGTLYGEDGRIEFCEGLLKGNYDDCGKTNPYFPLFLEDQEIFFDFGWLNKISLGTIDENILLKNKNYNFNYFDEEKFIYYLLAGQELDKLSILKGLNPKGEFLLRQLENSRIVKTLGNKYYLCRDEIWMPSENECPFLIGAIGFIDETRFISCNSNSCSDYRDFTSLYDSLYISDEEIYYEDFLIGKLDREINYGYATIIIYNDVRSEGNEFYGKYPSGFDYNLLHGSIIKNGNNICSQK